MSLAKPGFIRDVLGALPILAVLAAVYLLPPDASLGEVRRAGILHVCLPPLAPPFVVGETNAAGIDLDILRALAADLELSLATVPEPAMGRDFNPRGWHVTRAACEVLAGGVVASTMTRSFLETTPSYAETGWALLRMQPAGPAMITDLQGRKVGVFAPPSGLERTALSSSLRAAQAEIFIIPSAEALVTGLREQRFEAGVTEKLIAERIAAREGFAAEWFPGDLPHYPVAFGLWKGDLTLKRAIAGALERRIRDGTVAAIMRHYLSRAS